MLLAHETDHAEIVTAGVDANFFSATCLAAKCGSPASRAEEFFSQSVGLF